jgi:hypothetical protein
MLNIGVVNATSFSSGGAQFGYSEGTFTPTILFSPNPRTTTYSAQIGRYVKIGKAVTAFFRIDFTYNNGAASFGYLNQLPFFTNGSTSIAINHGQLDGLANPLTCDLVEAGVTYPGITAPSGGFTGATAALGAYSGSTYTQFAPQLIGVVATQTILGTFSYITF